MDSRLSTPRIREVWADNLDEEMSIIRRAIDQYPFVAMVRPLPAFPCQPRAR